MNPSQRRKAPWLFLSVTLGLAASTSGAAASTISQGDWFDIGNATQQAQFQYGNVDVDLSHYFGEFLDQANITVSSFGSGAYEPVKLSTPLDAVTLTSGSQALLGGAATGGITLTKGTTSGSSSGSSLTITNLTLDLTTGTVHGKVAGDNGVGVIDDAVLWTFQGFSANTTVTPHGMCLPGEFCVDNLPAGLQQINVHAQASHLMMTTQALGLFDKALNLNAAGQLGLQSVADLPPGTVAIDARFIVPQDFSIAAAVPEPGAFILAGVGLLGVAARASRRKARQH